MIDDFRRTEALVKLAFQMLRPTDEVPLSVRVQQGARKMEEMAREKREEEERANSLSKLNELMEEYKYKKALLKKTLPNPTFFDYLSYLDLRSTPVKEETKKSFQNRMNKTLDTISNRFNSGKDSAEPFSIERELKPSIA